MQPSWIVSGVGCFVMFLLFVQFARGGFGKLPQKNGEKTYETTFGLIVLPLIVLGLMLAFLGYILWS